MTYPLCKLLIQSACLVIGGAAVSAFGVTVTWEDNSSSETGFKIERATDGVTFVQVGTVPANVVTYSDNSTVSATKYSYRVAAFNATTTSAYSNVTTVTTPAQIVSPSISTQPTASQTVAAGKDVTFTVTAKGTPAPTYQWKKNGISIPGSSSSSLALLAVDSADAATYTVVVSNDGGSVTSANAILMVQTATIPIPVIPSATAPSITTQPIASQTAVAGSDVSLVVVVSGSPAPSLQWKKNGTSLPGATDATLLLSSVDALDAGTYTVVATNSSGSVKSSDAVVKIGSAPSAEPSVPAPVRPTITSQPVSSQSVEEGQEFTLSVTASGSPAPSFQWKKNGIPIEDATENVLRIEAITKANAGSYTVVVSNSAGSVTSSKATVTVLTAVTAVIPPVLTSEPPVVTKSPETNTPAKVDDPAPTTGERELEKTPRTSRLVNLSVRAVPGPDEKALLVGFVVDDAPKSMLVRAVGPGLSTYTDATVFTDPKLTVFDGSLPVAKNENWGGTDALKSSFSRVGAFPLPDTSKDAVVLTDLAPKAYTANVSGDGTGLALAEIYDGDAARNPKGRLVNLSARAHAGPGNGVLIVGFVIDGDTPLRVLVRGIGPTLATQKVSAALTDPKLDLYRGNVRVKHNDNWSGTPELKTAFAEVGAFALPDAGSKDAALVATLEPGAYTAIVSGVAGAEGIALAEVYELR